MEDIELLSKVKTDDRDAFNSLFLKYYPLLSDFCRFLGVDSNDGEDIIADVFLDLWVKRERLQIHTSLKSYLYGAVKNRVYTLKGKNQKMELLPEEYASDKPISDHLHPDEILFRKERRLIIERFIDELPEQGKLIFLMNWQHQLEHHEIAEILNISPNTVKTHIYRAINYCRKRLLLLNNQS
jgi:RNA polymerase sigma-70 factor (ECF subfamily)